MGLFGEGHAMITRLTPDSSSPRWVHVVVGGRRAARVPAEKVHQLGLEVGAPWTAEVAAQAALAAETFKAKLKGVALLKVRGRSAAQLAARLQRAGFSKQAAEGALAELSADKLLDDAALAESGAQAALAKGLSNSAVRARLAEAGVPEPIAASAVAKAAPGHELSRAIEQASNRAARWPESLEPAARYRRVLAALARLGYDEDVARQAAAAVIGDHYDG